MTAAGLVRSLVLVALVSACADTQDKLRNDGTLPPELAQVLTDYEAAWHAKDPARLAELFVDDGFVLSNGFPPIRGRTAIREFYTGKGGPLALRPIAWSASDSLAYIIGVYARERGEQEVGKFTLTLALGPDGRWLIVSDMDNQNSPAR